MKPRWRLKLIDKLGEALAGFVCGIIGFLFHVMALLMAEVGAVMGEGEPVRWGRVFWAYAIGGAVLGALIGEPFFKYIERRWFERD